MAEKPKKQQSASTATELGRIVKGIPVSEALLAVDGYLGRTEGLKDREACQAYWRKLSHDEKIELTAKALKTWR